MTSRHSAACFDQRQVIVMMIGICVAVVDWTTILGNARRRRHCRRYGCGGVGLFWRFFDFPWEIWRWEGNRRPEESEAFPSTAEHEKKKTWGAYYQTTITSWMAGNGHQWCWRRRDEEWRRWCWWWRLRRLRW